MGSGRSGSTDLAAEVAPTVTEFIDVSLPVSASMLVWPGDPPVSMEASSRMSRGDSANVSELKLGSHTGTHVDPPFHFIDGAPTAESLALDDLIGEAFVGDLRSVTGEVSVADLEALEIPTGVTRLLMITTNSQLWRDPEVAFPDEYVSLSLEGAQWLVANGFRLVGTDFLSIERRGAPGHPVHVALLQAGVVIVEGLNLGDVEPGTYTLACLPLKIVDGDGAPARAVLMRDQR